MGIENVAAELRSLRSRIDAQRVNDHDWPTKEEELTADLDRYDRRLLKAAAMLSIEAPQPARDCDTLLSENDRQGLEVGLAEAGLDVTTDAVARGTATDGIGAHKPAADETAADDSLDA